MLSRANYTGSLDIDVSSRIQDAGIGRVFLFVPFWMFACLTSKSEEGIWLTLPLFFLILSQVYRIKAKQFTVFDMVWFCLLVFFVLAPMQSLNNGYFENRGAVSRVHYDKEELYRAMFLVFISLLSFIVGQYLAQRYSLKYPKKVITNENIRISDRHIKILFFAGVISFAGYVWLFGGIENVLAARREKVTDINILAYLFLAMHVIATMLLAIGMRSNTSQGWFLLRFCAFAVSALLLWISVNPFNVSRFTFVGSWFPIGICLAMSYARYTYIYAILFASIIVVMPVMSVTTRLGSAGIDQLSTSNYAQEPFLLKDIDVFDTLTHSMRMMEQTPYYGGANTTAIALFFVPRAIWQNKPIVGGLIVGNELYKQYGAGTPNLSFFAAGDFYMDFGYVGVVIAFLSLGYGFHFLCRSGGRYEGVIVSELILAGAVPILIRGPVGAVLGYCVCLFLALAFYKTVFYKVRGNSVLVS